MGSVEIPKSFILANPEEKITIENGMSRTMVTVDDELITVLFVKSIRPKKKKYVKAADPDFDF